MHGSDPSSPKPTGSNVHQVSSNRPAQEESTSSAPEQKRRPGRPRGSKNRRPRVGSAKHETAFYYQGQTSSQGTSTTASAPPQHPNITPQNQQYYEFQWRVLNLCAEFYTAAEELVKQTSPLVVAQCYHMGPGVKIDPLVMLAEAKRICDTLPPAVAPQVTPTASSTATPAPPATIPTNPPSVITNPQSFVVPLTAQPGYPQYPIYTAPPGYPTTTPYYQYAAYPPGAYYAPQQSMATHPQPAIASASSASAQPTATITTTPATGGTMVGNQGAWSEEETERLKALTEESRSKGPSGDIEWDWVIQEWGLSRTRHQILIKATALGLKESSTRGVKRRRDNETSEVPVMSSLQHTPSNASNNNSASASMALPSTSSPANSASQPASTPAASPALQHQQRPASSKGPTILAPSVTTQAPKMPWPMPAVAVNTSSPIMTSASTSHSHEQQRASYYRPRPNQSDPSTTPSRCPSRH
ncbi:hypothetical protein CPB84DRAFT_1922945, partial [Gymnopilus junonius]